jgi:hypothetical protein
MRILQSSLAALLLCTGQVGAQDTLRVVESSSSGAQFAFIVTPQHTTVIPKTIIVPASGQTPPGFILQKVSRAGKVSYTLSLTFSYQFDTNQEKLKKAAETAQIDTGSLVAIPLLHYVTYYALWNSQLSTYELKKLDEGTTNPSSSLATAFSLDFPNASALREFIQGSNSLNLVVDSQIELQLTIPRDTQAIDSLVETVVSNSPISTSLPTLDLLKRLQSQFGAIVGSNPSYVAEALSRQISNLSLTLDDHGAPVYSRPSGQRTKVLGMTPPARVVDRIASVASFDFCTDPGRLTLIDIGKTGCEHLDELLK